MPPHFRALKAEVRRRLADEAPSTYQDWLDSLPAREIVNPLLACLPQGDDVARRAAVELGRATARLADGGALDEARNVLRRLMWHMNEESGNIGWGIPEAFAEILVNQRRLADEFHPVLLSYILDTGKDDNYCDHDILRRSCFRAVARLAEERPELAAKALPALRAGLNDADGVCRVNARHALEILDGGGITR